MLRAEKFGRFHADPVTGSVFFCQLPELGGRTIPASDER
jgi:hypothetical protein